jgi:hypothetical protein
MKTGDLVKKVNAHLKTLTRGGLAVQPVVITIDEQAAAEIAKAGDIALDAAHVAHLQNLLGTYATYFQVDIAQRSSKEINDQLDSFLGLLDKLKAILDLIDVNPIRMTQNFDIDDKFSVAGQIIFGETSVLPQTFKRDVAAVRDACQDLRFHNSRSGKPPNFYLPALMNSLASLYRDAGGASTRIQRGTSDHRKSRFVDFAWAAMLLLPGKMQHSSKDALAIWWEKHGN